MKLFLALLAAAFVTAVSLLLYKYSGPDFLTRYDKPLSYAEAIKKPDIRFPFPASSSEIYYAEYADWQAYTKIVRFKAPVEDCLQLIDIVTAENDRTYHQTSSWPRVKVTRVDFQHAGWLDSADWFRPDTITNGLYVGGDASHQSEIWVDLDKGIFYLRDD